MRFAPFVSLLGVGLALVARCEDRGCPIGFFVCLGGGSGSTFDCVYGNSWYDVALLGGNSRE